MEQDQKIKKPLNPRKGANVLSLLTFAFTVSTFRKGFRRDLQEEDITEHLKAHDSKRLGDRLEKAWKNELVHHRHPSLWRALIKTFGVEFALYGLVLILLEVVLKMSQPIALSQLIKYFSQGEENLISDTEAYICAGIIVGVAFINVLVAHIWLLALQHFGLRAKVAFCSIIYRKTLKLNRSVLGGSTVGEILNLLSNDVSRCDRFVLDVHGIWLCPLEIIAIVGVLYYFTGLASTAGVFFMLLLIPLQMFLGKKTSEFRLKTALKTDQRMRLMNEIISGIQVIKMYTWEKPFAKLVAIARRLEIRHIKAVNYIRGIIASIAVFATRFGVFVAILTYALLGNQLTADYVFVVTSFYSILRFGVTFHFPLGVAHLAEFKVSVSRIQKFLLSEEVKTEEDIKIYSKIQSNGIIANNCEHGKKHTDLNFGVHLNNATARWVSNSSGNTLSNINFQAQSGQLVAIVGPVGSGKTSLLHAVLKELSLESGGLSVEGTISYASQEPWVFAGSVRQNILFGQPMVPERYHTVVKVCALEQDFVLFPYGDETLVGERGVTLSGGQRARVSLARAIYKEADIYLLDDPLSAVDTHVGKQLFDDCVSAFLEDKCTILVTHQLQYLQNVDRIYLVENGKITMCGKYQELQKSGVDFTKQFAEKQEEEEVDLIDKKKDNVKQKQEKQENAPTETKEQRSSGKVSNDVYLSYFKAGGSLPAALVILCLFVLTQLTASGFDYFLTYWVNLEQKKYEEDITEISTYLSDEACIYIISGIAAFMVVVTLFRSFSYFKYAMKASITLHDNLFSSIVQAPMRFFNTNSSGRIINRFSKDMGSIDELLPIVTIDCVQLGLTVLGVLILISVVNPWLLIVTAIMLPIFYSLRVVFMKTSRSLKRLEGITRSPVFSHVNASLQGLTTIRASGAQTILQREFDDHQNANSSVSYWFISCSRAFAFWLDLVCVIYIGSVTFSFFLFKDAQYGGNVGLAITQALSLMGMFQWLMRQWTELENQMTSVERVIEYTKIDPEVDPMIIVPPPSWPEEGNISFISVSLRYSSEDPYVLKQLNFNIQAKEKIGIVGRTGAGKSSLISALFQLTKTEGAIVIDSTDVTKVPLHSLRSKISIIPQEPVLFSGAFRKNLDPFDEYPDEDLWKALEEVELKKVVADLSAGLNSEVSEGGSNFSVGQRQLVCLARAIIRKNKILVLDEATANVDPQTDILIQNTIRRKFIHCTVLTIAHRLHTIMDSDRVLVMDQGNAVEFDHPHLLLKNKNGVFYGLVQQTGFAMAENLRRIANDNYTEKYENT